MHETAEMRAQRLEAQKEIAIHAQNEVERAMDTAIMNRDAAHTAWQLAVKVKDAAEAAHGSASVADGSREQVRTHELVKIANNHVCECFTTYNEMQMRVNGIRMLRQALEHYDRQVLRKDK